MKAIDIFARMQVVGLNHWVMEFRRAVDKAKVNFSSMLGHMSAEAIRTQLNATIAGLREEERMQREHHATLRKIVTQGIHSDFALRKHEIREDFKERMANIRATIKDKAAREAALRDERRLRAEAIEQENQARAMQFSTMMSQDNLLAEARRKALGEEIGIAKDMAEARIMASNKATAATLATVSAAAVLAGVTATLVVNGASVERQLTNMVGLAGDVGIAMRTWRAGQDMAMTIGGSVRAARELIPVLLAAKTPLHTLSRDAENLIRISKIANTDAQSLALIYAEVQQKGRLYREDMLQFGRRNIPVADALRRSLGITTAELNKLVSEGKIGYAELSAAMDKIARSTEYFGGAISAQALTLEGKWERAANMAGIAWEQAATDAANAFEEIMGPAIDVALDSLQEYIEWNRKIQEPVTEAKQEMLKYKGEVASTREELRELAITAQLLRENRAGLGEDDLAARLQKIEELQTAARDRLKSASEKQVEAENEYFQKRWEQTIDWFTSALPGAFTRSAAGGLGWLFGDQIDEAIVKIEEWIAGNREADQALKKSREEQELYINTLKERGATEEEIRDALLKQMSGVDALSDKAAQLRNKAEQLRLTFEKMAQTKAGDELSQVSSKILGAFDKIREGTSSHLSEILEGFDNLASQGKEAVKEFQAAIQRLVPDVDVNNLNNVRNLLIDYTLGLDQMAEASRRARHEAQGLNHALQEMLDKAKGDPAAVARVAAAFRQQGLDRGMQALRQAWEEREKIGKEADEIQVKELERAMMADGLGLLEVARATNALKAVLAGNKARREALDAEKKIEADRKAADEQRVSEQEQMADRVFALQNKISDAGAARVRKGLTLLADEQAVAGVVKELQTELDLRNRINDAITAQDPQQVMMDRIQWLRQNNEMLNLTEEQLAKILDLADHVKAPGSISGGKAGVEAVRENQARLAEANKTQRHRDTIQKLAREIKEGVVDLKAVIEKLDFKAVAG